MLGAQAIHLGCTLTGTHAYCCDHVLKSLGSERREGAEVCIYVLGDAPRTDAGSEK